MAKEENPWYIVDNISEIDSPALLLYPDRIQKNIDLMIDAVGSVNRLRPHVKTHKMAEIVKMQLGKGIQKFKCATIAEAEMLASCGVKDVLLAYQAIGPKALRLRALADKFPLCDFACLIDNAVSAQNLSALFLNAEKPLRAFIDLDVGMHRTGISAKGAVQLADACKSFAGIQLSGIHAYDGHVHYDTAQERSAEVDSVHDIVTNLRSLLEQEFPDLEIVVSGSPSFPYHAAKGNFTCSPGTSLLWDWRYGNMCQDQHFLHAALVLSRIISKPGDKYICLDLGHKNVASEMSFPRVHFFQAPDAKQIKHSEEHLVLNVGDNSSYEIGQVFYGVPMHICPTVALHDRAHVVQNGSVKEAWRVIARDRLISV